MRGTQGYTWRLPHRNRKGSSLVDLPISGREPEGKPIVGHVWGIKVLQQEAR